jgi:hypothetical protein
MLSPSLLDQIHTLTESTLAAEAAAQPSIYARMDSIMNPVLEAAQTAPIEQVEDLIGKLPLGYYRQTLRVTVIERTRPEEAQA